LFPGSCRGPCDQRGTWPRVSEFNLHQSPVVSQRYHKRFKQFQSFPLGYRSCCINELQLQLHRGLESNPRATRTPLLIYENSCIRVRYCMLQHVILYDPTLHGPITWLLRCEVSTVFECPVPGHLPYRPEPRRYSRYQRTMDTLSIFLSECYLSPTQLYLGVHDTSAGQAIWGTGIVVILK